MTAPASPPFPRLTFEITPEDASVAASRLAMRRALASGLTLGHLAPLAAFVLAMLFAAILAWTGLISSRHGEIAILTAATAFLIQRIVTRRRFRVAQRESAASLRVLREAGPIEADIGESGVTMKGAGFSKSWRFADSIEIENAVGLIFLWPRTGDPAILPTRVFSNENDARAFIMFVSARLGRSTR